MTRDDCCGSASDLPGLSDSFGEGLCGRPCDLFPGEFHKSPDLVHVLFLQNGLSTGSRDQQIGPLSRPCLCPRDQAMHVQRDPARRADLKPDCLFCTGVQAHSAAHAETRVDHCVLPADGDGGKGAPRDTCAAAGALLPMNDNEIPGRSQFLEGLFQEKGIQAPRFPWRPCILRRRR
jgi:hypothetical protein